MKKVFKKIRSIKLPSSLLIFLAIFVVSIFGLQVSKMYAQTTSFLSSSLGVQGDTTIGGSLTVNGGMGVGSGAPGSGLIVHGGGNFSGMVYGTTPMENQPGYLATVSYVQSKVASIPACPTCPSCNSCCGGSTPPSDPNDPGPECVFMPTYIPCYQWENNNKPFACPTGLFFVGYSNSQCVEYGSGNLQAECCGILQL